MFRRICGFAALAGMAVVASVVTVPTAIAADGPNLRFSQWLPPGHWSQRELMWVWFKEVAKATDGRAVIQPSAKGLGAPPRQYQLAVDGITDVGYQVQGYTPVTKLRDGLSKRVFDGTCFTDEAVYALKIGKFVKHATHIPGGLYNLSLTLVMNQAVWNKISAKDQATIDAMAGEVLGGNRIGRKWDEREAWAPSQLKKDGVTWNTIGGQDLVDLKARLAIYEEQWIAKAGVDGKAALKMFRAEVDRYGS